MARKNKGEVIIEGLKITDIAAEGNSLGRWNDKVVFVPMALPGDVVDVKIVRNRRRFMEGAVIAQREFSPLRVEPFCEHFGLCGGCKWQNLPYAEQLKYKQKQVEDQLSRIGKVDLPEVQPILASPETQFYRNKLEFTFSYRRWMTREEIASGQEVKDPEALGFHIPGMFDKVMDVKKCWLQPDPSNAIRLEVRNFSLENGYSFHNSREHSGLMRNLLIRTSSTGEVMVIVVFGEEQTEKIAALMAHLAAKFPEITSLYYVVNTKWNDSISDQTPVLFAGRDHILEQMEGLRFKIGPKSFYQTNSAQALKLYETAREMAGLKGGETVYDLYTGTGTIACFVAAGCKKVVGIEYVPEAIEDANQNAALNAITNASFHAGDMKKVLTDDFIAANGRPDVVIVDPPRAGMDAPVVETLLRADPLRIVYVSCNPATQARDIALMAGQYKVEKIQPVDMFPHTQHVENVVLLSKICAVES